MRPPPQQELRQILIDAIGEQLQQQHNAQWRLLQAYLAKYGADAKWLTEVLSSKFAHLGIFQPDYEWVKPRRNAAVFGKCLSVNEKLSKSSAA